MAGTSAPSGGAREALARLAAVDDPEIDLAEAALAIAALGRPSTDIDHYRAILGEYAADLARLAAGAEDAEDRAACLGEVLVRRRRFQGDDRDDDEISNGDLTWVIDHRRGIAEALGIIYLDVARAVGWTAEGLAFPGHFLVRLQDEGGRRVIVDPFAGAAPIDAATMRALLKANAGLDAELEPALYESLGNRDILVRLQNELKLRLLRCGRIDRALGVVETILTFAPDRTALWREAGLMHMRLDNVPAAIAALEQFAARTANAQARSRTLALLRELRARLT